MKSLSLLAGRTVDVNTGEFTLFLDVQVVLVYSYNAPTTENTAYARGTEYVDFTCL